VKGGLCVGGAPKMHNMSSLSQARHIHLVHGRSHEGMVLSYLQSLILLVLIRVKQWVVGWASSVFASACLALLCWFVLRLCMCLLMQHDSRWRHISLWWDVHGLHVGDRSCLRMWFFF
jgi:hypothetical protein